MPKPLKNKAAAGKPCPGGLAYNRIVDAHRLGKVADVFCERCKCRLGCSTCVPARETCVCKRCRDYAFHVPGRGGIVKDPKKVSEAWSVVWAVYKGTMTEKQAESMFNKMFAATKARGH